MAPDGEVDATRAHPETCAINHWLIWYTRNSFSSFSTFFSYRFLSFLRHNTSFLASVLLDILVQFPWHCRSVLSSWSICTSAVQLKRTNLIRKQLTVNFSFVAILFVLPCTSSLLPFLLLRTGIYLFHFRYRYYRKYRNLIYRICSLL